MYGIPDLETFIAVAQRRNLTAAARQLGISPATASHRIGKLEAALNITLFRRAQRRLTLTDEGQIFHERVDPILNDLRQAEIEAGAGRGTLRGHLRATMSPWILTRFILPVLPAFRARHPDLSIEFLAVDRFVALSEEGVDCAIRVGQMRDSSLIARRICDNDRVICASPALLERVGRPSSPHDLGDIPWVTLPWQTRISVRSAEGRRHDLTLQRNVQVSNSDTLTEAALNGLGFAVKSRLAVQAELAEGRLIEVMCGALDPAAAPIWFVAPPEGRAGRKVAAFRDLSLAAFSGKGAVQADGSLVVRK